MTNALTFGYGHFEYQESKVYNSDVKKVSFNTTFGTTEIMSFGINEYGSGEIDQEYIGLIHIKFHQISSNTAYTYTWDLSKSASTIFHSREKQKAIAVDFYVPEELREENVEIELEIIVPLTLPMNEFVFFADYPWTKVGDPEYLNKLE